MVKFEEGAVTVVKEKKAEEKVTKLEIFFIALFLLIIASIESIADYIVG